MPSYVLAYAWLSVSSGITGFFGSWLVLSISTTPYVFLAVSAAFNRHSGAGEEVARTLGRSQMSVARTITWPAIRTSVFGSGLLVALYTLSDFGAVSLMRFDTFTRAIYNAYRASFRSKFGSCSGTCFCSFNDCCSSASKVDLVP